jgi:hypothetical protein
MVSSSDRAEEAARRLHYLQTAFQSSQARGKQPMSLAPPLTEPRLLTQNGRVLIEVNWEDADALREYFAEKGLPGTVNLDPLDHAATIDFWAAPDTAKVSELLAEWHA